ncbi:MAG: dual specificity protein phosphatase family protein [Phycisphaerales bacterium]|nr:dual specificity protein phosphatase family protein [Phycisphaerales bacterium]
MNWKLARDPYQWWMWLFGLVGSRYDGLRHFSVVEPGVLMRCGQPRASELAEIQKSHGLRTIVCARGGTRHPLRGRWFRKEQTFCQRTGVQLVHMPFSDKSMPPEDIFERFLEVVRDPDNQPVLVHCEQGFHRTGILCAAHRIANQNWPIESAIAEMEQLGFETHVAKRQSLLDALRSWSGRRLSAAASGSRPLN